MLSIYNALTANGSLSASGIKSLKVYYDTLLLNVKTEKYEFVLLENLNFDYDTNILSSADNGSVLKFGDTNNHEPNKTQGNGYFDSVLLEKEKVLLICGLSAYQPLTQIINGQSHSGSALVPIVYEHDLNSHDTKLLYPIDTSWETNLLGNISKYSDVAVNFNIETNVLNYLIKTTRTVNSSAFSFWLDIEFIYRGNELVLSNMRSLTANNNNDLNIISFRNYNNSEKIVVTALGQNIQTFKI